MKGKKEEYKENRKKEKKEEKEEAASCAGFCLPNDFWLKVKEPKQSRRDERRNH